MTCLTCQDDVSIVKVDEYGVAFLSCLHKARVNDNPSLVRSWTGLRDGQPVTIDLTASPLIPLQDLNTGDLWNPFDGQACPACGAILRDVAVQSTNGKTYVTLACGHSAERLPDGSVVTSTTTINAPVFPRQNTIEPNNNIPRPAKDYLALCPVCGRIAVEIGSHQQAGAQIVLKLKCGHKAVRTQESALVTLEQAGYRWL